MVALSLWGAMLGPPCPVGAPVALPIVLALGGLLGLLHLLGVPLGETRNWPDERFFVRTTGGDVALVGLWCLERALT